MESVLINVKKKADAAFIVNLAKKLGMFAKPLSKAEIEDWQMAQKIESGMKTSNVSKAEIIKALS